MPSFFGSKKDKGGADGDDDPNRAGLFGKKSKGSPAPENPYAQQSAAPDAYTNDLNNKFANMNPYGGAPSRASQGSGLPSGPRAGGGLPSGPGPRGGYGSPSPGPGGYGAPARSDSDNRTVDTLPRYTPTAEQQPPAPGYSASKYGASGGYGGNRYDNSGSSYGANQNRAPAPAPGARGPGGYGGFGRDDGADDANRDALLGGARDRFATQEQARTQKPGGYGDNNSSSYGGYGEQRELTAEELEEQEYQDTKSEIKQVKNETISSLDNSLRYIEQAEEMARGTLNRIGAQNERLHNTDRNLDLASNHNLVAEERAKELKKLNGSMFAVHVNNPFTKKARKEARDNQVLRTHQDQREQRLATRKDQFDQQERMDGYNKRFERTDVPAVFGKPSAAEQSRFQLPGDDDDEEEEDRQKEERINQQLEMASRGVGRLKQYGMAMGEEIEQSNKLIDRLGQKSDRVDDAVRMNRARIDRIR